MQRRMLILVAALCAVFAAWASALACTTMIVTKGASADGSMMVAHSDDDELGDQRVLFIPAMDHPKDAQRQVFHEAYPYPRFVTDQRGPGYDTPGYPKTKPLGFIPQVAHTFAYYDGAYGIMNEHNLMMGECTNGAKYEPQSVSEEEAKRTGRHIRLFYSSELSRLALERCRTAREAVELMGALIDKYGYYSTGETLLVADENEAWVFEMCALPDETYHSAWVAQMVPDGEFFVAANEFRIRTVPETPQKDFLFSKNLRPGVQKAKWWDPKKGELDWLPTVSDGEYNHPYYSLRRVWRVMDRVNPDLALSPWVKDSFTTAYPFSIAPKTKLTQRDVFALYRDHYEGTPFDMTKGVAAGPYGDPHRFVGPYDGNQNNVDTEKKFYGAWERAISVFYQGYTFVCQLRPDKPEAAKGLFWFAPDVSYTSCFAPFYTKGYGLPQSYQSGSPQQFDQKSAWWAFDFVANWSRLNFQRMTKVDILPLQAKLEAESVAGVAEMDAKVAGMSAADASRALLDFDTANADKIVSQWWALGWQLVAKYSDGYVNLTGGPAKDVGYPSDWLDRTNYKNGPTTYDMK